MTQNAERTDLLLDAIGFIGDDLIAEASGVSSVLPISSKLKLNIMIIRRLAVAIACIMLLTALTPLSVYFYNNFMQPSGIPSGTTEGESTPYESESTPSQTEEGTEPAETTEPVETTPPPHSEHVYVDGSCTECGATEGLKYRLNGDGTATLYSDASCTASKVTIASHFAGCPVTVIETKVFENNPYLVEIVIPETVKKIEFQAFLNNLKLTKVTVLGDLEYIGEQAFYHCPALLSIDLPDSIEYIGEWAFWNCSSLTEISIPKSVKVLYNSTFSNCYELQKVVLHQGMTGIGTSCFAGCDKLTEIVDFPNDLDYVEAGAFHENAPIRTEYKNCIYIGGKEKPYQILEKIKSDKAYDTVELHPDTKAIAPQAFYKSSLKSIDIHENVEYIGYHAFANCKKLETVTMSDNVTHLGERAFLDCEELSSIKLSNSIKVLEYETFRDCTKLNQINLPTALETLESFCFESCRSLTELHFSSSVKNIDFANFDFSYALKIYYDGTLAEWEAINVTLTQYPAATIIASDGTVQY